jgi:hypothetical protein
VAIRIIIPSGNISIHITCCSSCYICCLPCMHVSVYMHLVDFTCFPQSIMRSYLLLLLRPSAWRLCLIYATSYFALFVKFVLCSLFYYLYFTFNIYAWSFCICLLNCTNFCNLQPPSSHDIMILQSRSPSLSRRGERLSWCC